MIEAAIVDLSARRGKTPEQIARERDVRDKLFDVAVQVKASALEGALLVALLHRQEGQMISLDSPAVKLLAVRAMEVAIRRLRDSIEEGGS